MQKVLVVDDQLDSARLLTILLKLDGYDAEWLDGSWRTLPDQIEARNPDLVVLDVRLPGVDGLDLVRQIRAHTNPAVARVPILLTSALDHRYEGEKAGASNFMLKPFTRETLIESIRQIGSESATA